MKRCDICDNRAKYRDEKVPLIWCELCDPEVREDYKLQIEDGELV